MNPRWKLDGAATMSDRLRSKFAAALLCLALASMLTGCNAGDSMEPKNLTEAAAQARTNVEEFTKTLDSPVAVAVAVAVAFDGESAFCADDPADEKTTEFSYEGSVKRVSDDTLDALASRYANRGWNRKDLSGDIYLDRDDYSLIISPSDTVIVIAGVTPCTPTPPQDDPLHPYNFQ